MTIFSKNNFIISCFISFLLSMAVSAQSDYLDYECISQVEKISLSNGPKAVGLIHKTDCEIGSCNDFFTGVLLNNTARDGRLLFLTILKSGWTISDYQNATIDFNWQKQFCGDNASAINALHVEFRSNHKVLYQNTQDRIILLELKKNDFSTYHITDEIYSKLFFVGWKTLHNPTLLKEAYLVHQGQDSYKKVSFSNDFDMSNFTNDLGTKKSFKIRTWKYGKVDEHSLGSPLFSTDGLVIGIYTGSTDQKYNIYRISENLLAFIDHLDTKASYILG